MAYKVYLIVELPESYEDKDAAMDAAVQALQDAVVIETERVVNPHRTMVAKVYAEGDLLAAKPHAFVVDICDGCI
jgi:hypothetical protein